MEIYYLHGFTLKVPCFSRAELYQQHQFSTGYYAKFGAIRRMSAKLVFVVFRQQTFTIQGVLTVREEGKLEPSTCFLNFNSSKIG